MDPPGGGRGRAGQGSPGGGCAEVAHGVATPSRQWLAAWVAYLTSRSPSLS